MATTDDIEVLIVGAGPTGLMLAIQLARRGIPLRIIDRHAGPARESRALAVQARTLEIYQHLGLADRALELGRKATGANLWVGGRRATRVPFGDIGQDLSRFPYLLILGQDDNERLLGVLLEQLGIRVEWNTELVGLDQRADRVAMQLRLPDGSRTTVDASWVAGCDGARSAVRSLNDIGFPGAPYRQVFFVADTTVTGPMQPDELNVYLWRQGFHLFFPMRGTDRWRIVGILPAILEDRDDIRFDEVVPFINREAGDMDFAECRWLSTYRIHHRRAAHFRDRRCFLLGDAAHIHSPAGGQGMNTGLQDAYNLGWKLALVASGRAGDSLLDSYATEREPVAQRLLETTDRLFSGVAGDSWLSALFRTTIAPRVVAVAMRLNTIRRLVFRTVSQTAVAYRHGPLAAPSPGLPAQAPQPGERFPWMQLVLRPGGSVEDLYQHLGDTGFNLLLFGQDAPAGPETLPEWIRTTRVPDDPHNRKVLDRWHIPRRSGYLLRPDGHVGLAGMELEPADLGRYLAGRVYLKPAASD